MVGILFYIAVSAQAQVVVNVNLGSAPQWGPAGYTDVRYYYLPDIEVYYDIQTSMFIYFGNGVWIQRSYLPSRCRGYDLYGGYKVVMQNYHGNYPYTHFNEHKMKYAKGYRGNPQKNIGQKPVKSGIGPKAKSNSYQKNSYKSSGGTKGGQGSGKGGHGKGGGKGKK